MSRPNASPGGEETSCPSFPTDLTSISSAVRRGSCFGPRQLTSPALAERELTDQALSLIELQLASTGELADDVLRQRCSAALARMEDIQRSGELGITSELPEQLRQLCAVLIQHRPADRVPIPGSGALPTPALPRPAAIRANLEASSLSCLRRG